MFILFIQRLYVNRLITNIYPILSEKVNGKLPDRYLKNIIKNVKAMLWHKIGDYCINGTDNLIISMFTNIASVGIYSNYLLIFNIVNSFIGIIFNSMTASIGNVIAKESKEKQLDIFNKVNFIAFWLYGFCSICFYNLLNPFIKLWIGDKYLLNSLIVTVLVINNFMLGLRMPVFTVKAAAGLYNEDKYVPLIQSAINLVFSVILIKKFGLIGVFLGTFLSGLIPSVYRPYLVYKKVFERSSLNYYKEYFKHVILIIFINILVKCIFNILNLDITISNFIIQCIICILIPNIIYIIMFRKNENMKYIFVISKKIIRVG